MPKDLVVVGILSGLGDFNGAEGTRNELSSISWIILGLLFIFFFFALCLLWSDHTITQLHNTTLNVTLALKRKLLSANFGCLLNLVIYWRRNILHVTRPLSEWSKIVSKELDFLLEEQREKKHLGAHYFTRNSFG